MPTPPLGFGPFELDLSAWRLLRDGQPVELQDKALGLIALLVEAPGALRTREELHERLWPGIYVSDDALFQAVRKARQALGDDPRQPRWIQTVPGRGYRFVGELRPVGPVAPPPAPGPPAPTPPPVAEPARGRGGVPCLPPEVEVLGRGAEQAQVERLFAEGQRLVSLIGPAGAGKTTLARLIGARAPGLARFVDLSQARDRAALLYAVGVALGADGAGPDGAELLLRALPAEGGVLLVLDNAETCVELLSPLLRVWMAQAPALRALVTSRRPLHLSAEQLVPLGPLAPEVAAGLFRARAAQRGSAPPPDQDGLISEVVRAVDALPLALELAASRLPALGLDGLVERLRQPLEVLRSPRKDGPERHRSLRAALDLSWAALDPLEQRFLAGVCVFRAPFQVREAERVVTGRGWGGPPALDLIEGLADASLLRVERAPDGRVRFALYSSVRELALERADRAWTETVRHRHLDWLLDLHGPTEPEPAQAAALLERLDDAAWAMRFGVERGRLADAAHLALWTVALLTRRGNRRRALDLLDGLGPEDALEPELELPLRLLRALVVDRGPQPERGPALFALAEERALALGRPAWQRDILLRWADATLARDHAAAERLLDRVRVLLPAVPDPAAEAALTLLQARVDYHRGQGARAWGEALRALGTLRSLGRGWWESQALLALAELAYLESRWADADAWARQALELAQTAQADEHIDFARTFRAVVAQAQGALPQALAEYQDLLVRARQMGNAPREQHLVYSIGGVLGMLGRLEEAGRAFSEALALARLHHNGQQEGWSLVRMAGTAWRQGHLDLARGWLSEAIGVFQRVGRPVQAEICRVELGWVELMAGELPAAEAALGQALEVLEAAEAGRPRAALARAMRAEVQVRRGTGTLAQAEDAVAQLTRCWAGEGEGRGQVHLGMVHLHLGQRALAQACLHAAAAVQAQQGDLEGDLAREVRRLRAALG